MSPQKRFFKALIVILMNVIFELNDLLEHGWKLTKKKWVNAVLNYIFVMAPFY